MSDVILMEHLAQGQLKPVIPQDQNLPQREQHPSAPLNLSPLSSVAWIVSQQPQLARILENRGVRYCCTDGDKSLLNACAACGVDVHVVLEELRAYNAEQEAYINSDIESLTPAELLERVQQNHQRITADVSRLSYLIDRVSNDHGNVFHELWELQGLFEGFKTEWEQHQQTVAHLLPLLLHAPSLLELENHCEPIKKRVAAWQEQRDSLMESITKLGDWAQNFNPSPGLCQTCRVMLSGLIELKPLLQHTLSVEENLLLRIGALDAANLVGAEPDSLNRNLKGGRSMSTILLVEEEPEQAQLYAQELRNCDYKVLIAFNSPQALQQAAEEQPDLVVLDLNLVGVEGLHLLEKLLKQHPHLPVIIHSAYDYHNHFITWCAEDHVTKSRDSNALKKSVAAVLERHAHAPTSTVSATK